MPKLKPISLLIILIGLSSNVFAQTDNTTLGTGAGASLTTGDLNTFVGDSAGTNVYSGSYNTIFGGKAGLDLTYGKYNVMIGYRAGAKTITANDNVFIGYLSGANNYRGNDNTYVGMNSGFANKDGTDNTFIGNRAGYRVINGDDNTFIGDNCGGGHYTDSHVLYYESIPAFTETAAIGSDNTGVGAKAGYSLTTGYRNTFIGKEAGLDITTGHHNTFVGDSAGNDLSVGYHNTMIGNGAGATTEFTSYNTFIGSYAGFNNNRHNSENSDKAKRNTYLGSFTGYTNREGTDNVGIGSFADFSDYYSYRNTFIGANSKIDGNDNVVLGYKAEGLGIGSVVIGSNSRNIGNYSVGIGLTDSVTGSYSIALGAHAKVSESKSMALGSKTEVNGEYSVAIGYEVKVQEDNSLVLGGTEPTNRMSVGIGTLEPNQNASLELGEHNKGFLISRMSVAEIDAFDNNLGANEEGMMVYDTLNDVLKIWDGAAWLDAENTDQSLSIINDSLEISSSNKVSLKPYLDNTDNQQLSLSGDTLFLEDGSFVDLEIYKNLPSVSQDLSLNQNTLNLSGDSTSVNLSRYLDNTDNQGLILLESDHLFITGATTNQFVNLSKYTDNTDAQSLTGATLDGTLLKIDIENGSSATVDLASLQGEGGTDSQDLTACTLNGTNLQIDIENGNSASVDLSSLQDGTGTDNQSLSGATLTGTTLQIGIEDGNSTSVDLAPLQDGTGTDDQNLTSATLTGTTLQIDIEGGNSVSVDLAPLMNEVQNQFTEYINKIDSMQADIAYLKALHDNVSISEIQNPSGALLYQNIPNPANYSTRIQYFLPDKTKNATLMIYDSLGNLFEKADISERGMGYLEISRYKLKSGTYFYSLIVDNHKVDTKKMILM